MQRVFGQFHSPWMKPCKSADYFISRFQLGKFFIVSKNIFIVKNLTDFRKTVETGVDPRLKRDCCADRERDLIIEFVC